ncbi:hypothetical protein HPHPP62_1560 [Helicobacter pylori Hp P-62]|nr:hypothetical protein HPHPP62_1560 [Helicobacter pylori Hp P-62]
MNFGVLWLLEWLKTTAKKSLFANRKGVKTCKPNDPKNAKKQQKRSKNLFACLFVFME